MADRPKHHKPLDQRFKAAISDEAYANLRALAEESCLGNNYVLSMLLENMDRITDRAAYRESVREMLEKHAKRSRK